MRLHFIPVQWHQTAENNHTGSDLLSETNFEREKKRQNGQVIQNNK